MGLLACHHVENERRKGKPKPVGRKRTTDANPTLDATAEFTPSVCLSVRWVGGTGTCVLHMTSLLPLYGGLQGGSPEL